MNFSKRGDLVNLLIVLISILLPIALVETSLRFATLVLNKTVITKSDKVLGWKNKPNLNINRDLYTQNGRKYNSIINTDKNSLRTISKNSFTSNYPNHKNKRVLVVGDSCTGSFSTSNNNAWFASMQKEFPLEVFAAGTVGYGTYQEWLNFEKIYPIIKPDILLIQFNSNDILNDSLEISKFSIVYNQNLIRPYLIDGKNIFISNGLTRLYRWLYHNSKLFRIIDLRIQNARFTKINSYLTISKNSDKYQKIYSEAQDKWISTFKSYISSARTKGIKNIWTTSCTYKTQKNQLNDQLWYKTSKELNLNILESPAGAVYKSFLEGKDVFAADGAHWNDIGNKIAGKALSDEINLKQLIKP